MSGPVELMSEAELRVEIHRLRLEVGRLARFKASQREAIALLEAKNRKLRWEKEQVARERDAFKNGDFTIALADQRAKLTGGTPSRPRPCGNCGCPLVEGETHSYFSMGVCYIRKDAADG